MRKLIYFLHRIRGAVCHKLTGRYPTIYVQRCAGCGDRVDLQRVLWFRAYGGCSCGDGGRIAIIAAADWR